MKTISLLTLGLTLSLSMLSAEVLTDIGYPPPGLTNFSSSGAGPGTTSGETWSYSITLDPSSYSALYWGPTDVENVVNSNQAPTGPMTYAGTSGGSYIFNSTALWEGIYNTRFVLTPTGLGAEDTEGNLGASTTPSYPLFQVNGDFSVNFSFQAEVALNVWDGVDGVYNSQINTNIPGVQDDTSVNFDFFTAPVQTPEPGSLLLLSPAAVLFGLYRRRSQKQ